MMTKLDVLQLIFMVVWPLVCSVIVLSQMNDMAMETMIECGIAITLMNMGGLCLFIFVVNAKRVKEGIKNERGY